LPAFFADNASGGIGGTLNSTAAAIVSTSS